MVNVKKPTRIELGDTGEDLTAIVLDDIDEVVFRS